MSAKTYTREGRPKGAGLSYAPQGVVFNAYRGSSQTAATGFRKVQIDTKTFDPYGWFDLANNRWQPKVPGYYDLAGSIYYSASAGETAIAFYKNGSLFQEPQDLPGILGANGAIQNATCLMYLNGSTDYAELYGYTQNSVTFAASNGVPMFSGSLVASSVGVAPEPWHVIGAAGEPAFQNGWQNQPGYPTAAFMKDPHGFVRLRGTIYGAAATANPAFTLPSGYRPAGEIDVAVVYVPTTNSDGASAVIQVKADGTVNPLRFVGYGTSAFSNTMRYVDLNAVSFRAEQ